MSRKLLTPPTFEGRPCLYDPEFDIQEVDQFGYIHLNEAFEKGIIPGSVELEDESYNGVENPGTLISRAMDVFDGLRKAEYVKMRLEKMNAEQREKAEKALSSQASATGVSSEGQS